jgi:hypothetical protein
MPRAPWFTRLCVPSGCRSWVYVGLAQYTEKQTTAGAARDPHGFFVNMSPQGVWEVGAPEIRPLYEDFPRWLGGMPQEDRGRS